MKARIGAVVAVLIVLVLAFASIAFSNLSQTRTVTISTTRTVTFTSANSPVVTEEVIIQPEVINGICFDQLANSTSTAYLIPLNSNASSIGTQTARTTTTVTLRAVTTTTIYENLTMIRDSTTCTLVNPYYNTTQSSTCPPCA